MSQPSRLEAEVRSSIDELVRVCKGAHRSGSFLAKWAEGVEPMSPLSRRSRTLLSHLESALDTMLLLADSPAGKLLERPEPTGRSDQVVNRCVTNLIERIQDELDGDAKPVKARDEDRSQSLSGFTPGIAMPELVDFLSCLKKTGTLHARTPDETFTVVFDEGDIIHAVTDNSGSGERLGDILVRQGSLTSDELDEILSCPMESGQLFGEIIAHHEFVTEDQLRAALDEQCRQLFARLFAVESAKFEFYDAQKPEFTVHARLDAESMRDSGGEAA